MAHTKAIGSTQLGRDSLPKYRGVKLFDGQRAQAGSIIVRQTGSSVMAGETGGELWTWHSRSWNRSENGSTSR